MIPFRTTAADRITAGDPRLSLGERYGTKAGYVTAVTTAANGLKASRLLLDADVQAYITGAQNSTLLP